jgi:hypothetical protein
MKNLSRILAGLIGVMFLSSCGAIPTLPSLDSTVSVFTQQVSTENIEQTPAESTLVMVTVTPHVLPSDTLEPEHIPTKTSLPDTATATIEPSSTPTLTPTVKTTSAPANTPTPTKTSTPTAVPYALQKLNPYYLANFTHPEEGCNWMGVAGQIFDRDGQVQLEVVIKAGGSINGVEVIETMTMPLTDPDVDLAYGPGGFEITLADSVEETESKVWIQLFNLAGDTLSEKINLVTFDNCQKNLILMNFISK